MKVHWANAAETRSSLFMQTMLIEVGAKHFRRADSPAGTSAILLCFAGKISILATAGEGCYVIISAAQCLFNAVCVLLTQRQEWEGPEVRKAGRTRRRTSTDMIVQPGRLLNKKVHTECVTSHSYPEVTPPHAELASKCFLPRQSPTLQIAPLKVKLMAPFHVRASTFTAQPSPVAVASTEVTL